MTVYHIDETQSLMINGPAKIDIHGYSADNQPVVQPLPAKSDTEKSKTTKK